MKFIPLDASNFANCISNDGELVYFASVRTFCGHGKNGQSPCSGDSGGGFFSLKGTSWILKGTVSSSKMAIDMSCNGSSAIIYTDVREFVDWIDFITT